MKVYCQQCGSGTDYTYEKPNFCVKCGTSFSSFKSPTIQRTNPKPSYITQKNVQVEDEEPSLDQIRGMSKLEVDIGPVANRKTTLRDIAGTRKEGEASEYSEASVQPIDTEEFAENFKREAGFYSSRQTLDEEA